MSSYRQRLGAWGEKLAAEYLVEKGYTILDRNVRTPYGEIDLVARDRQEIVFIEVKTRRSTKFGNPEDALHSSKMTHMEESAQAYILENVETEQNWRVDVIAILDRRNKTPEIWHFENVLS